MEQRKANAQTIELIDQLAAKMQENFKQAEIRSKARTQNVNTDQIKKMFEE